MVLTRVWLSPQFILQIKIRWSLYHFQTACAREPSLKLLYIYILRGCMSLRARPLHQDSICCAPRTLGCFVPLGWALLFTLTLSTRQGSIWCRYLTLETRGVLCPSTLGACRALTDLWRVMQGECIPAEQLSRNVITYRLEYVHKGDFTWVEMRRKLSSHSTQVQVYIMDG